MTAAAVEETNRTPDWMVTAFRAVAIAEAISWAGLLIAMLFKYALIENPTGVRIVGPIHGAMFLGYVVATIAVGVRCRWKPSIIVLGLAAAIPPFATVIFEVWTNRTGRLDVPEVEVAL